LPCTQQASVDVFRNGAPGQPIIDTATNFLCLGDTGFYFIEPLPDADTTFWYFGTEDTLAFTIDTGFHYAWPASGGKFWVRIQGKNDCGWGPVTDTLIEILPLNTPELFNLTGDSICLSDSILYTWNPDYPGGDSLIWNIPGGNVTNLSGDNFSIRWANPGIKYPRLVLQNGNCFSGVFVDTIYVDTPLSPPVIVCTAQTNQVTFNWSVPPGVTNQNINLLNGPAGTLLGNSYQVSGLNPGDSVSIEVIFEGNSLCDPSRDTAVCIAQKLSDHINKYRPCSTHLSGQLCSAYSTDLYCHWRHG
jgi:hypothetical protein